MKSNFVNYVIEETDSIANKLNILIYLQVV